MSASEAMSMSESPSPQPLSEDEHEQLRHLLRRFCAWDLDQWEMWRTGTPYGPVYITITRRPEDGATPEASDSLDRDA